MLNATSGGPVPSSRQETRLPSPERTLISPRSRSSICRAPAGGWVGVLVGVEVGVDVGVVVGDTEPVQVVPLRVKASGSGLAPFHEPLKPKETVPPVGMAAL